MLSDAYLLGVTAANKGQYAVECPFPTGANRKEWLAGFFSVKPSLPEEKQRPNRKASVPHKNVEQSRDLQLVPSSRSVSSCQPKSISETNPEGFVSEG